MKKMKGGVVPLDVIQLQERLSRLQTQFGQGFPVQSQHEGNCASDAIQIILFFSDGIGKRFARQAIREFQDIRNPDIIYDETWITNQISQVQAGDNLFQKLGDVYARVTSIRYLRMIDEYEQRLQPTGFGLARTESQGASIERPGVRTPIGVVCSSVFAVANRRLQTPAAILARRGARNRLYGYTQENYDPIVNRVLELVAPGSRLVTGSMTRQEQELQGRFMGRYRPTPITPELDRMVGVQFFFIEEGVQPGHDGRGFHTLSFFKHGGSWYIGDNEVGIAIRLPEGINTQHILNNSFSFQATAGNQEANGLYRYQRVYYTHPINADGSLGAGVEITRANYSLTSPTSGTYLRSYEDVGARREWNPMPRKYFIPPVQPDVWYGQEPRQEPLVRRIFPADMPVDFDAVGLEGYLTENNQVDIALWNSIPVNVTLYPVVASAGGNAGIQPRNLEKFVTADGIYGVRVTIEGGYGGNATSYKLNRTQGRQSQYYITVNGIRIYLEPTAAAAPPARRITVPPPEEVAAGVPARPATAVDGVAAFAAARRAARAAAAPGDRTGLLAIPGAVPLGFGFPGTTAAATVTPARPATAAPSVYGFPGTTVAVTPTRTGAPAVAMTGVEQSRPIPTAPPVSAGDYVKSGEPLPAQFRPGSRMVLTDLADNRQVNVTIQSFINEAHTGDAVVQVQIDGVNGVFLYKIGRNRGVPGIRVATPYDVYLAPVTDWGGRFTLLNPTPGFVPRLFTGGKRKTRRARKARKTRRRR